MISVTELRAGTVFEDSGNIFIVQSYEHIKMGRGSANIKVKVKNIKTGATTEKGYINGAKVNPVIVLKREMQYLYKDGESAYFMDGKTFEQIAVPLRLIDGDEYLKEGMNFSVSFLDDDPLSVDFPPKMELLVSETGPGYKGNSTSNLYKDAILENGLKTRVPLFIEIGDKIKIDTRTGAYTQKA
jgi:elongation factor P